MKRLRAELKAAGVFEHHELSGWLKLGLMFALLALAYVGLARGPAWAAIALAPLAALAATTATLIGHEGSHGSFSGRRASNRALEYLTLPVLSGVSSLYWKHKHNVLHHGHPNVVAKDPDVELWLMATTSADYDRAPPLQRWFQRNLQAYFFWPLTLALPTLMRAPSYVHLYRHLRDRGPSTAALLDAACLVAHYALWLLAPALAWGPLTALAIYVGIWALAGPMLAAIFAPAHMGMPVMLDAHAGWRQQLETTRNFRTPRWLAYFYVGLDHQVEHHIFPRIPHQNLRRAGDIMRRWCGELGLPYHEDSVVTSIRSATAFLRDAWQIDASSTRRAPAARPPAPRPSAAKPPAARPSADETAAARGALESMGSSPLGG